jgi:hypothetical protein
VTGSRPPVAAFLLERSMSRSSQPDRRALPHGTAPRSRRLDVLPASLAPRGLCRVEAAAYVGVSPSLFDAMVRDGRMPGPKLINSRAVWDRFALDLAFEALPDRDSGSNPWDDVTA